MITKICGFLHVALWSHSYETCANDGGKGPNIYELQHDLLIFLLLPWRTLSNYVFDPVAISDQILSVLGSKKMADPEVVWVMMGPGNVAWEGAGPRYKWVISCSDSAVDFTFHRVSFPGRRHFQSLGEAMNAVLMIEGMGMNRNSWHIFKTVKFHWGSGPSIVSVSAYSSCFSLYRMRNDA